MSSQQCISCLKKQQRFCYFLVWFCFALVSQVILTLLKLLANQLAMANCDFLQLIVYALCNDCKLDLSRRFVCGAFCVNVWCVCI